MLFGAMTLVNSFEEIYTKMAANEYKPKDQDAFEPEIEPIQIPDSKPKEKKTKSSQKQQVAQKKTFLNKRKIRSISGALLLMASIYLFLACLSYLFTWKIDQDRVLGSDFFEFIFGEKAEQPANWLGKFGAWCSHVFIYCWFGLASFGFIFLGFLFGVKLLFDLAILPLATTTYRTLVLLVWTSLFLGFFNNGINYLGGTFGYYINDWLSLTFGSFGAFVTILVLGYIVLVVLFNPDFSKIIARLIGNDEKLMEQAESIHPANQQANINDLHVVNTIKDDQITEDAISETVSFGEEENSYDEPEDEGYSFDDSELIITKRTEQPTEDFEVIQPQESTTEDEGAPSELEIEVPKQEEALTTGELNDLRKEYGDYDPTLDLASYVLPPIDLLKEMGSGVVSIDKQELEANKNRIVETLLNYKIDIAKIKATVGPTVTLYEIVPAPGVRISKIKNLEDDIALSLSALGIRIIAPIPGKGTIGIEVPNSKPEMVSMRSLIASEKFQNSDAELPIVMGKTITNETFTFDLTKMPHLLVAGATGQGKSVGLNAILISILYKKHPAQVKFVLVDPKKVELTLYNKIERHFLAKLPGEEDAIITDTSKVVNTLNSLCIEMDDRYALLKEAGVRTIKEYNTKFIERRLNPEKGHRYLPYIVVLIDEFADLIMTAGKEVEHPIARIAQLARAVGIHLIVATQRPSVNVITGMIKANFPARIAFRVLSKIDSRTILDASGADQLIGRGDMLISTGSDLKRLQCGFVDTPEVEAICSFIGDQRAYPEALLLPEYVGDGDGGDGDFDMSEIDPMFADAARIVVMNQQGSASLLQRKLKLGYNRAGRIVDQLEGMNIIGAFQGSKPREVLFGDIESLDEFLRTKGII